MIFNNVISNNNNLKILLNILIIYYRMKDLKINRLIKINNLKLKCQNLILIISKTRSKVYNKKIKIKKMTILMMKKLKAYIKKNKYQKTLINIMILQIEIRLKILKLIFK